MFLTTSFPCTIAPERRPHRDPLHFQSAGMVVERPPAPDLVIAEMQRRSCTRQQGAKTFFPPGNRHRSDRFAIEVEEIERE
jgi:hypothetical protein